MSNEIAAPALDAVAGPVDESWTVPQLWQDSVQRFAERPCLEIVGGLQQSYAQAWDSVLLLARRLAGHGVQARQPVLLMLGNGHLAIHAWLAVNMLNAVDVGINTGYKGDSLVHAVNLSEAATLLTTAEYLPVILRSAAQFRHLRSVVLLDDQAGAGPEQGAGLQVLALQDWQYQFLRACQPDHTAPTAALSGEQALWPHQAADLGLLTPAQMG